MCNKVCGWCKIEKPENEFHKRKKNGKETLRNECKECYRNNAKKRYIKNKKIILDRNKSYYDKNRDKLLIYRKEHSKKTAEKEKIRRKIKYQEKSEEIRAKRKKYYNNNKEACINQVTNYVKNNKEKVRATQRRNHHKKRKGDFRYKILKTLRTRVTAAVKNQGVNKKSKTMDLVGCSILDLKKHLESKFLDGMSWDNHSFDGWHIDHIIPCAKFDLSKEEEQRKCFHYTNLQPLWAIDNFKKGAKLLQ